MELDREEKTDWILKDERKSECDFSATQFILEFGTYASFRRSLKILVS